MRAALYARISTADKGQDLDLQLDDLRNAAAARDWTIVATHTDTVSAAKKRPGLDALLADVAAGKVDVVAIWKIDRMSRSLQHLLVTIDTITKAGAGFIAIRNEGIDTTTPSGRLMLHILGACAEFERELIRERVQAGMDRVKRTGRTKSGKPVGRPRRGSEMNPKRNVDLERVKELRDAGRSWSQIAVALKVPHSTLHRWWKEYQVTCP